MKHSWEFVGRGWLEAFWMPRPDHSGVELHWRREPGTHWAAQLTVPA
jgi:hypothetical protein